MDLVDKIMDFESGSMSDEETIRFFSELIKSGQLGGLQGMYQRQARELVDAGYLDENGDILKTSPD